MSYYPFAPLSHYNQNHAFLHWRNGFTNEEIDRIRNYCDTLITEQAMVGGSLSLGEAINESSIRSSKISWVKETPESRWFYDKLAWIGRALNSQYLGFNLTGFNEDMQYTVYDSSQKGHYTWHNDLTTQSDLAPRKLSLVLQLSDPSEYEGGDFQTMMSREINTAPKEKGFVMAFPSWTLHRVTPVTSGVRRTLVVWVCGPSFV